MMDVSGNALKKLRKVIRPRNPLRALHFLFPNADTLARVTAVPKVPFRLAHRYFVAETKLEGLSLALQSRGCHHRHA